MGACTTLAALGLHLASLHSEPGYNGANPGVYVETKCGIVAGAYYNSVRRPSVYVGYTFDPENNPVWATVAAVTGYKSQTGMAITPVGMIGLKSPDIEGYRLRIGWIPKIRGINDVHVFHLMIERRF